MPDNTSVSVISNIPVPSIDRLAKAASFDSIPNARGTFYSNRPISLLRDVSTEKKQFLDWWNSLVQKEREKIESQKREAALIALEKELGLPPVTYMMTGKPSSKWEEFSVGTQKGLTHLGQMAAGIGSIFGLSGAEERRKMYQERLDAMNNYLSRYNPDNVGITPGDIASRSIQLVPEFFNPTNKPGNLAKSANAVWHAIRGYAPNKSIEDAAVAAGASALGERAEDVVTKGKGLVGNTVGALSEELYNYINK